MKMCRRKWSRSLGGNQRLDSVESVIYALPLLRRGTSLARTKGGSAEKEPHDNSLCLTLLSGIKHQEREKGNRAMKCGISYFTFNISSFIYKSEESR